MKFLKNEEYNTLKQAADSWNKLTQSLLDNNPDVKAEDFTPEQILQAMESDDRTADEDLQNQLNTALNDAKEKDKTIGNLTSQIEALKGTPASGDKGITTKEEPLSGSKDIKDFASKNEGDTLAIMVEAEKEGFFKY